MKIAANALRIVHKAYTELGRKQIGFADKQLLIETSRESTIYLDPKTRSSERLLKHPEIFLPFLLGGRRSFLLDSKKIFNMREQVGFSGLENIPQTGPVIVAFSHIDRWKDLDAAPNWEKFHLINQIQRRRGNPELALVAYISYFIETAPLLLKGLLAKYKELILNRIHDLYQIDLVDVNPWSIRSMKDFYQRAMVPPQ